MSWIKSHPRLVFCLTSILFLLVFAEFILRLAGIGYGNSPIEVNQRLHHLHPKNYEFTAYHPSGEYKEHQIYYDEFGYRVSSKNFSYTNDSNRRIAFLGDGFTEANPVSWNQSFIGLIEMEKQNLVVRNFGVAGYSPYIYLVQLKNEVKLFQPTDVVVQILENDFYEDRKYSQRANSKRLSEVKSVSGGVSKKKTLVKILRYSYLARLLRKVQQKIMFKFLNPVRDKSEDFLLNEQSSITKTAKEKTYEAILLLKDLSKMINAQIFFFVVPNKELAMQNQCCESDSLANEFREFSESNNLNLIDLAEVFGKYPEQSKLFFEKDGHFTPLGHSITAKAISKNLRFGEK